MRLVLSSYYSEIVGGWGEDEKPRLQDQRLENLRNLSANFLIRMCPLPSALNLKPSLTVCVVTGLSLPQLHSKEGHPGKALDAV